MSLRTETARLPGSKPTFKTNLNWSEIPESMAEFARRWAGGDTEQAGNHQMGHNNFFLLCPLFFFFDLSQDWEIHSRHGVPFWLLPAEWKQYQTGSVRVSGCHLGRQRRSEGQIPRGTEWANLQPSTKSFCFGPILIVLVFVFFQYTISRQAIPFSLLPASVYTSRNEAVNGFQNVSATSVQFFSNVFCHFLHVCCQADGGEIKWKFCSWNMVCACRNSTKPRCEPSAFDEEKHHGTGITYPTEY